MKTFLCFLATTVVVGCASAPPRQLPDGIWTGDLHSQTSKADGNLKEDEVSHLLIASCGGRVHVWYGDGQGQYKSHDQGYSVRPGLDTHLFFFAGAAPEQPDWVEIQVFTMLEIDQDTARVQWNRTVNNRDLEVNHPNRFFFGHGIANLRRASKVCEARFVPSFSPQNAL